MTLRLGNAEISTLRLGTATPSRVMLGDVQVWPVGGGELWTPANLTGTDWEWFDYNDRDTVTVVGSGGGDLISEMRSKRPGGAVLSQTQTTRMPVHNSRAGMPLSMFTDMANTGRGFTQNATRPSGTVWSAYVISLHEVSARDYAAEGALSQFASLYMSDRPNGQLLTIYNPWSGVPGADRKWQINGGSRLNGQPQPPGTTFVDAPGIPWTAIRSVGMPSTTASSDQRSVWVGIGNSTNNNNLDAGISFGVADRLYEQVYWSFRQPSLDEIEKVEGYMAWKPENENLGLVAMLPSDHPYKNSPPMT